MYRHVFQCAHLPIASIVNQDVDPALFTDHPIDGENHCVVVSDVHRKGYSASGFDMAHAFDPAGGSINGIAFCK
jgi:hypothetical protein